MKRFHLFFSGDSSKTLKGLQEEGLVEINTLPEKFGFEGHEATETGTEEVFNRIEMLKNLVKKMEGNRASEKIVITQEQEKEVLRRFRLDETYERFSLLLKEFEKRENIVKKLHLLKEELLLLRDIDITPADLFSMKNFSFSLFRLNKKQKNIPEQIEGFSVGRVSNDDKNPLFLVIFPKKAEKKVLKGIEKYRGEQVHLRRWNKTPSKIIKKIDTNYQKNKKVLESTYKKMGDILSLKREILVFHDHANNLMHYQKAKQTLKNSLFVTGLTGWVKENDVERLINFTQSNIPDSYLHISEPDTKEEADIPIALENNHIVNPFEIVTDLYGRPVYKNLDPTIHLSIFFVISFAFCITDAAYGLILIILSLVFMKKFRFMPTIRRFLRLILYSGAVTLIMGTITGGWFGDLLTRLPEGLFPVKILRRLVVLNPLEGGNNAFIFLGWALVIGYLQILWGLSLNLFNSLKQYGIKKSGEAFTLLFIQILVAVIVLSYTAFQKGKIPAEIIKYSALLLAISFIYLMINKAQTQKGLIMKSFWALYGGYNVIASNLLGDVLSYSRLFGLGLTTAVLGLVVNEMVFMSTGIPYIGYIIASLLFILGHMGNLAINLLGGYVHTSRLQYLEFFTKFFESGGRPFNPFREIRNYTYIETGLQKPSDTD
jgi:V/A-type H+/Na+-transporting ATPase subunit I